MTGMMTFLIANGGETEQCAACEDKHVKVTMTNCVQK